MKTSTTSSAIAQSSPRQWALFFFTLLYVCLEFGFNNQLLKISAVDLVSDDVLLGLEFWGRILSGVGLSLVLYRNSSKIKIPIVLRYLACLVAGIVVMWQVQTIITDYLVAKASLEDKEISLILATLSIPPLTLGISIFFALLNLAQWLGMCLQIFKTRLGLSISHIRQITSIIFIAFLLYSFMATSAFADSKAYQKDLAPALYANHLVLAVLTSISAHAVPNWHFLSSWCNRYVLGGVQLKRPY